MPLYTRDVEYIVTDEIEPTRAFGMLLEDTRSSLAESIVVGHDFLSRAELYELTQQLEYIDKLLNRYYYR